MIALVVAVYAIHKGDKNSSVATLVTLTENCRGAWQRFLDATTEDEKSYELAELVNLLEVASAILNEDSLTGVSNGLLKVYLQQVIALLEKDEDASREIDKMLTEPGTFENIRKFYKAPPVNPLSIVNPKRWFQR